MSSPTITIDGILVNQPTPLLPWLQFAEPIYKAVGMTKTVDGSGNITWTSPNQSAISRITHLEKMIAEMQLAVANIGIQTKPSA